MGAREFPRAALMARKAPALTGRKKLKLTGLTQQVTAAG